MICQKYLTRMFKMFVSLLWLFLILPVPSHGQCSDGGPDTFDWHEKDDINLDESRYIGEWFTIDCRLTHTTANVSLWRGEGGPEKEIVPDQHKVTELNQIFNITNLNFKDEGNYYCKAPCNKSDKSLGYLYINSDGKAYQTPEISNKSDGSVPYGSKLNMDCKVTGWYVMHWYRNDPRQPVNSVSLGHWTNNDMRITQKRLIIERFTEKNDGVYTCMVQRQHVRWTAFDKIYLKAKQVKPVLQKKEEINVINATKTSIVLQCTVEKSYPPAVFEWRECIHVFNNCSNIQGPGWFRKEGNSSKEESTLIVTMQEFQKVSYQCSAINNLGQDSLEWIVINKRGIMSTKPRITKTPQFETAGDNVKLVCESNGSVVMEWKKRLKKLRCKNTSYKRNGFDVTRKSLEIRNFTKMDEGVYECHVTVEKFNWNDHDKVNIEMEVKPKIIKSNSKIQIKYTKGMELKCELTSKAIPQADIWWSRCVCDGDCSECNDWFKLRNNSIQTKSEIASVSKISSLTSEKVIYRCKVRNIVGSDERKWILFKESTPENNKLFFIIIFCNIFLLFCIFFIMVMELWKCTQEYIFQTRNDNEERKMSLQVRSKPLYIDRETCL